MCIDLMGPEGLTGYDFSFRRPTASRAARARAGRHREASRHALDHDTIGMGGERF